MESELSRLEKELNDTRNELKTTKEELRLQNRRVCQLVAACSIKVQEKEREMQMLRALKDGQLQSIIRQLLHFESVLRQEQKKIVETVQEKDLVIAKQAAELEQLKQMTRHWRINHPDSDRTVTNNKNQMTVKNSFHQLEDKENVSSYQGKNTETPVVTKMIRRFEVVPTGSLKKPEVPKKPARLSKHNWKMDSSGTKNDPVPVQYVIVTENDNNCNGLSVKLTEHNRTSPESSGKGVSRTDSVNDHGYFTLEKRKPVRNNKELKVEFQDEMDLRQNFEEFHLDSLEEEEQHLYNESVNENTTTDPSSMNKDIIHCRLSITEKKDNHDRSSGDGAEFSLHYETPSTPTAPSTPTSHQAADTTGLNVTGSILLPQLGDATPNAVQFDRFLEVTGLTQKSILTPSRQLSNHKNMLKPKDVKHRNKVKSAALVGQCRLAEDVPLHHNTNQVRYYVEPFL